MQTIHINIAEIPESKHSWGNSIERRNLLNPTDQKTEYRVTIPKCGCFSLINSAEIRGKWNVRWSMYHQTGCIRGLDHRLETVTFLDYDARKNWKIGKIETEEKHLEHILSFRLYSKKKVTRQPLITYNSRCCIAYRLEIEAKIMGYLGDPNSDVKELIKLRTMNFSKPSKAKSFTKETLWVKYENGQIMDKDGAKIDISNYDEIREQIEKSLNE